MSGWKVGADVFNQTQSLSWLLTESWNARVLMELLSCISLSVTNPKSFSLYSLSLTCQETARLWKDVVNLIPTVPWGAEDSEGALFRAKCQTPAHGGRKPHAGPSFRETWRPLGGGEVTTRKAGTNVQKPTNERGHHPLESYKSHMSISYQTLRELVKKYIF